MNSAILKTMIMLVMLAMFVVPVLAADETPPSTNSAQERGSGWRGEAGAGRGRGAGVCGPGRRADCYGACHPVLTVQDVPQRLKRYLPDDATVERIQEHPWYFEAEIRDKDGKLLDRVIIHKRSGRVRSIL